MPRADADENAGGAEAGSGPESDLRPLRTERDRLKARLLRREALLRVAARRLRRYDPGDPVAKSIEGELGEDHGD